VLSPAIVEWSAPDQAGHRRIARYQVERRSSPAADATWLIEHAVAEAAATRPAFRVKSSALPAKGEHVFRVCAINERARSCSAPVATMWTDMRPAEYGAAAPRFRPDPGRGIEAMPRVTAAASAASFAPTKTNTTLMKAPSALGRSP
jgi:hypothetical protein